VGYKREKLQLLGGGFNCQPPVDKVPKTDYLQAQNWRVDRFGRLVSRFGYYSKFTIASAGLAHSAFVNGGIEGDYYIGCNNAINPTSSSLYWNFNSSAIATGFDGNRICLACMNGWVYFMNRGNQGRHQHALGAGASQTWNLAAPTNSPVPTTASNPSTSASVTYNYTTQGSTYVHFLNIAGTIYSFVENGYSAAQLPLVIASLASQDPNCTVSYSGSGSAVVITPIVSNTLVQVSGSDGNTATNLANGAVSSLPNGTYQFYVTFESADQALESNPSPVSVPIALASQSVTLASVPVSSDARVGIRNIYATGGTLGQPYQMTTIGDNTTTSITFSWSDLAVTNLGQVMPTTNDPPPAAAGMVGPHFSRLFAWSTAANPNRLFYTDPDLPQYWPGSTDPAEGDWVDVGSEGEAIIWCTVHTNILVIYKERSVWMLVGDPSTGYLQQMTDATGISGQFAVVNAGNKDYLVGPGGLKVFDMDRIIDAGSEILPLMQNGIAAGATPQGLTGGIAGSPGSILPGTYYNANSYYPYALALGFAMGKLYIGYAETIGTGTSYNLLVYHEDTKRWFTHRNAIGGATGFFGFIFDGQEMVGLTGVASGTAAGFNVDDFRDAYTADPGPAAIPVVYQSHMEDAGLPDSPKQWLEVVVDYEFAGDTLTVSVGYNNNSTPGIGSQLGTITGIARRQQSFPLNQGAGTDGVQAKNITVQIAGSASHLLVLHNVYLYYYEEARLAAAASTLPTDLGIGKVKQCKELELDIDAPFGATVNIYSDLPGNALAVRQTPTVSAQAGRAIMRYPLIGAAGPPPTYTEGYVWRVALTTATAGDTFQLYSVRLLMRPVGVYVEAYEAAAGFVWDSMEESFATAITKVPRTFLIALAATPIKRFRELRLEIDTFNSGVTYSFLTDLPGNAQAVRQTGTVNTGTAGRRYFNIPLPAGINPPIEGRLCRLQLSGSAKFVLYDAACEVLPVGVYIEAYEAAAGAVYDSRQIDFGSAKAKEAREIELDIETTGAVTATLYSDLPTPYQMAQVFQSAAVATTGRQKIVLPLTTGAAPYSYPIGRLFQLIVTGTNAYRLYSAKLKIREFGTYLTGDEVTGGAVWDSTPLDFGSERKKELKRVEFDLQTDAGGTAAVTVYTNQTGSMAQQYQYNISTGGTRQTIVVPVFPGIRGRLIQIQVWGSGVRLFAGRVWILPLNEAKAQWTWAPLPIEPTPPQWTWAPFSVNPTPPGTLAQDPSQWIWGRFLQVEETPPEWKLIDVPFEVTE
jgi:hypothetical protein